jgi:hypothetical protein
MRFSKLVFVGAGIWGILLVTPLYFMFDALGRQHASPITNPQFYFGFLAVTMAWQIGFLVIGSDPARFRPMMIPGIVEKFGYVVSMAVLYLKGRILRVEASTAVPDLMLGVLFVMAFVKSSACDAAPASRHTV